MRRGASSDAAQNASGAGDWRPAFVAALRHGELTRGRLRTLRACVGWRKRSGPRYVRASVSGMAWPVPCLHDEHREDGVRFNHDALYIRISIRTVAPEPASWVSLTPAPSGRMAAGRRTFVALPDGPAASLPTSGERSNPQHAARAFADEREGKGGSDTTHRYIGRIFTPVVVSEPTLSAPDPALPRYAQRILSLPDLRGGA